MKRTLATTLSKRLYEHDVCHIFGVPGDYVLDFYCDLDRSELQIIDTCDEQGAGFAADVCMCGLVEWCVLPIVWVSSR